MMKGLKGAVRSSVGLELLKIKCTRMEAISDTEDRHW